jgi:hypothetical protein
MALGKMALAAAAGRHDEFRTDAALLAANGADVAAQFSAVLGPTTGSEVQNAWIAGDNARVDYMVAAVTHDHAKMDAARGSLDASLTQLSALSAAALKPADGNIPQDAARDASNFRNFVDEIAGGLYQTGVPDLVKAQFDSRFLGRALVRAISNRFPDRYPGNAEATPPTLRTGLAADLLSGSYLLTAVAAAAAAGNQPEQDGDRQGSMLDVGAITGGLSLFSVDAGQRFEKTWDTLIQSLASYAKGGDAASRQAALAAASPSSSPYGPDLTAAVSAVLQVLDDQRARSYDRLAADDRAAAAQFATVADAVIQAAIQQGIL